MALPLLAAALIVRDEAQALPGCLAALRSLAPLIDHVVVHDTGSVDGTPDIARVAGATVIEGTWEGDFAAARNIALAATRATWVLVVDADERVCADVEALRAALVAGERAMAGVVQVVNVGEDGVEQYAAPSARLLRPDRVQYVGRVHEQPRPIVAGTSLDVVTLPAEALVVRHFGYADADVVRRKAARNLELASRQLDDALAADPPDEAAVVRALYHRGRTLLSAGRVGDALVDLEHLRALTAPVSERIWGLDVLAQLELALGRADRLADLVGELRHLGADGRYCDWLSARLLLGGERYDEALELLRGIDRLVDTVGRELDLAPVVEAQMIAAGRAGQVDEAAACCIRLMSGLGRAEGLGPLLLTLWGERPVEWLVELLTSAGHGHLGAVAAELRTCPEPGPEIAAALTTPSP